MDRLISRLGLPVLTKELIEQAARRRTWISRTSYLGLLIVIFLWTAAWVFQRNTGQNMLGAGGELFSTMINFQWWTVYVLVPLFCFGLITSEKERDSLQLLFLTRLGPSTILFEKLLSRLVPLSLFLVATLPLLAVAYSYGGVSPEMLVNSIISLAATAFFLASIALMFSTYAFVSTQAFFGTLAFTILMMVLPLIVMLLISNIYGWGVITTWLPFLQSDEMLAGMFFGPVIFWANPNKDLATCLVWNAPQLVFGMGCLVMARLMLTRRAVQSKSSVRQRARRLVDRASKSLNRAPPDAGMPEMKKPITWIERRQGMSGRPVYLIFLFVVIGGLLTVGAAIGSIKDWLNAYSIFCLAILWMVAPLTICGKAAGLFGTERARQTLDVLLTTPIDSQAIVRQKMGGVWPLSIFLLALFLLVCSFAALGADSSFTGETPNVPMAFTANMVTALVYLELFSWLSVIISLRAKTAARATTISVMTLAAWCIGPWLLIMPCLMFAIGPGSGVDEEAVAAMVLPVISPSFMPYMSIIAFVTDDMVDDWMVPSLCVNTILYTTLALVFRWTALRTAARALDRPDRS